MEGVLAAVAQFDNDIRAEKTVVGMKEALARGRWTFQAPLGYQNVKRPDGTPTLEADPESGPLIRKGFQLYASGLHSKKAVLQQLNDEGLRTKRGRPVAAQTWDRILKNPISAGRIQMDDWGIDADADFKPLVEPSLFNRAQTVLAGIGTTQVRYQRNHPDFPLRRFVRCAACEKPLTGSWSSGKLGRRYAYYRCPSCSRVSVAKDRLETLFLELLERLQPKPEYLQALRESVLEIWRKRQTEVEDFKEIRQKRKVRIE
jgi:DNA-directed RNA polymerase subunit RPC12/RpoP